MPGGNNGNNYISPFVDWAASNYNTTVVVAGNEGSSGTSGTAVRPPAGHVPAAHRTPAATGYRTAANAMLDYTRLAPYTQTNMTSDTSSITGYGREKTDLVAAGSAHSVCVFGLVQQPDQYISIRSRTGKIRRPSPPPRPAFWVHRPVHRLRPAALRRPMLATVANPRDVSVWGISTTQALAAPTWSSPVPTTSSAVQWAPSYRQPLPERASRRPRFPEPPP